MTHHVTSENFRDSLAYITGNGLEEEVLNLMLRTLSFEKTDLGNPHYIANCLMTCMGEIIGSDKDKGWELAIDIGLDLDGVDLK